MIYFRTDPEVAYERVKKRSRHEENLIPKKYLSDLHELHEDWLFRKTKFQPLPAPVTVIDANQDLESIETQYHHLKDKLIRQATLPSDTVFKSSS